MARKTKSRVQTRGALNKPKREAHAAPGLEESMSAMMESCACLAEVRDTRKAKHRTRRAVVADPVKS